MTRFLKMAILGVTLIWPVTAGGISPAAASSLMSACKPDVQALCDGVSKGRGRISACLYAHGNQISKPCRPELSKVTQSGTFKKLVPSNLDSLKGTADDQRLRQVCARDIRARCRGAGNGTDRVLACLYAWSNRIAKECQAQARAILSGSN